MPGMRCHYEVLEVDRRADDDELKKQYKKLALKWHPDKNVNNVTEATERFKELTAAFTVLINPGERRWYDDHRQEILRGEADSDDDSDDDNDVNIWPYFSSSCYSGEFEGEDGFYAVYGDLFTRLDNRESEYASYNARYHLDGNQTDEDRPPLGDSSTSDADVIAFYAYWTNFVSCLSFAELDKYNTNDEEIPRSTRRAMEKENKKYRAEGRREYTDSVRQLVEYIKRLDERSVRIEKTVREKRQKERAANEAKRLEEQARRDEDLIRRVEQYQNNTEEIERSKEERQRAFLLDNDYDDVEFFTYTVQDHDLPVQAGVAMTGTSAAVTKDDEYRCAVCEKTYLTAKQFEQHNNSKPHKQKEKDELKKRKGKSKADKDAKSKVDISTLINSVISGSDVNSVKDSPATASPVPDVEPDAQATADNNSEDEEEVPIVAMKRVALNMNAFILDDSDEDE